MQYVFQPECFHLHIPADADADLPADGDWKLQYESVNSVGHKREKKICLCLSGHELPYTPKLRTHFELLNLYLFWTLCRERVILLTRYFHCLEFMALTFKLLRLMNSNLPNVIIKLFVRYMHRTIHIQRQQPHPFTCRHRKWVGGHASIPYCMYRGRLWLHLLAVLS